MSRPKGGKNKKWTIEEKQKYVLLYLEEHLSFPQIECQHHLSHGTLERWIKKYLDGGKEALENKPKPGNLFAALHTSKKLSEEERLKLIIMQQEIEIERLKKGYIVKGAGANKEFDTLKDVNLKS